MSELVFIGDIAFTGLLSSDFKSNYDRFKRIIPYLKGEDKICFANLEVPITTSFIKNALKSNVLSSSPIAVRDSLELLNIDCVSIANNHIYDYNMQGVIDTISILQSCGIAFTGAGYKEEHVRPIIITKSSVRVGFISYVSEETNPFVDLKDGLFINFINLEKIRKDVHNLKSKVDIIVCSLHWGRDYSFYPTQKQRKFALEVISSGVDVIMGHHPHTIQPFEKIKDKYIFYSLGGLTFGDYKKNGSSKYHALYRKTKRGLIVHYSFSQRKMSFVSTHEAIGNYLTVTKQDYVRWSKRKWVLFKLRTSSPIMEFIFQFKENVWDRMYEYFFGYYNNPIARLFQFHNLVKLKKLFKWH